MWFPFIWYPYWYTSDEVQIWPSWGGSVWIFWGSPDRCLNYMPWATKMDGATKHGMKNEKGIPCTPVNYERRNLSFVSKVYFQKKESISQLWSIWLYQLLQPAFPRSAHLGILVFTVNIAFNIPLPCLLQRIDFVFFLKYTKYFAIRLITKLKEMPECGVIFRGGRGGNYITFWIIINSNLFSIFLW